jgi:hypothetical protein
MRALVGEQKTHGLDDFAVGCVLGKEVVAVSEQLVEAINLVEELMRIQTHSAHCLIFVLDAVLECSLAHLVVSEVLSVELRMQAVLFFKQVEFRLRLQL